MLSPRKGEKDDYTFQKFFEGRFTPANSPFKKSEAYSMLLERFLASFEGSFRENEDGTKAFRASLAKGEFAVASNKNMMYGLLQGGITNIDRDIYGKEDGKQKGTLSRDKVASLQYFFLMWTPFDSNTGLIFIQSYSGLTINSCLFTHLKHFFGDLGHSFSSVSHTPEVFRERFLNKSYVQSVAVMLPHKVSGAGNPTKPTQGKIDTIKLKVEFSGFHNSVDEVFKILRKQKFWGIDYESMSLASEQVVYYVDEAGHKSHAVLGAEDSIKPTIYLPDSLKQKNSEVVNLNSAYKYCCGILEQIKEEEQYSICKCRLK